MINKRLSRTPFICPICSETLEANVKSCPGCGACERSGWSQDAAYDGLDFGDEEPDERRLIQGAFGPPTITWVQRLWWLIALILVLAFIASAFR